MHNPSSGEAQPKGRRARRAQGVWSAEIFVDGVSHEVLCLNMSSGGAELYDFPQQQRSSMLCLKVQLPECEAVALSEVVWRSADGSCVGIRFTGVEAGSIAPLKQFLSDKV